MLRFLPLFMLLGMLLSLPAIAQRRQGGAAASAAADSAAHPLMVRHFVAPAVGLATGTAITFLPALKEVNPTVRSFVQDFRHDMAREDFFHGVDDVMQLAPAASVFVLKGCGVPSRHTYVGIGVRMLMTYGLALATTRAVKSWTGVSRPYDETVRNSFFSGHTCTAFAGAEMLRQEYHDVSPWIGIGAYAVCSFTGMLRVYNDRHWLGDVLAGAGAGILCAEMSYWLCDKLQGMGSRADELSLASPVGLGSGTYQLVSYEE